MMPSGGLLIIIMLHKFRGCEYDSSTHKTENYSLPIILQSKFENIPQKLQLHLKNY